MKNKTQLLVLRLINIDLTLQILLSELKPRVVLDGANICTDNKIAIKLGSCDYNVFKPADGSVIPVIF